MPMSILCLVLSGLLWGTGGLIGTLLGQAAGLSAMCVAAFRLLAGGGLIVAFLPLTRGRWPAGRAAWIRVAVNGLLSALFQGCYFAAIALTSVSLATFVTIGGAPVIVALVEQALGRRPLGRAGVVTMVVALAGLGLLAGAPSGGLSQAGVLAGTGLALLSAAGFAAVTLIGTSPEAGLHDLTLNGLGFILGGLVLLPLAAVTGSGPGFRPGLASAGLLAALAIGPTAAAYTLYYRGLREAPASTAALLTLIEPLAAAVLAALVLGDRLTAPGIAGAVLLLAAVARTVRADSSRLSAGSGRRRPLPGGELARLRRGHGGRLGRRQVDQAAVGDHGDGQVHHEEDGDRLRRLPQRQDVDVRKPQDQRDGDGHAQEDPARRGTDPGDDWPGHARDYHPDYGQLRVVGELEVRVALGGGEDSLPDDHQESVGQERPGDGGDRRGQHADR
jgi:drug/metabolite transporter, DME family